MTKFYRCSYCKKKLISFFLKKNQSNISDKAEKEMEIGVKNLASELICFLREASIATVNIVR